MSSKTITIQCPSCRGTGLYSGFLEPPGTAVICHGCHGSGKAQFSYEEFTVRKQKRGIRTVSRSRESFILTGVGAVGESMTYAEFRAKDEW